MRARQRQALRWVACFTAVAITACAQPERADRDLIRIADVAIIDVDAGTATPDQDVIIRGDRIAWAGPAGAAPLPKAGATIDGAGLFLSPGLWDAHVHVYSAEGEPDFALPLYILNGVTSIRDMGALIPLAAQRAVNLEIAAGDRIGPRIINAGAMIDGPPGSWPGQMVAATPEEGRARVREAAALGWTSVKAYSLLDREVYVAVAEEADAIGLPLYGHIPEGVSLADALAAGHDVIEHVGRVTKACSTKEQEMIEGARTALASPAPFDALMTEMAGHAVTTFETWDEALCRDVVRSLAEAGVAVAPTLMVADFYLGNDPSPDDPRMQTVPLSIRAQWGAPDFRRAAMSEDLLAIAPDAVRQDRRTFKLAHDTGVLVLASSDAAALNPFLFHGATLVDELARYVEIGLTPREALATATTNPARLFGEQGETGRIETGARADLILLRADPLADISAVREIEAVIAGGRVFSAEALQRVRADLIAAAKDDAE
ncbi:MAG: amidohydrolase family protein [Pseudomonadota bacterium]